MLFIFVKNLEVKILVKTESLEEVKIETENGENKNLNYQSSNNNFLGTEKVGKLLRMFAIPCVLGLVIQALYNIVDQLFIGLCGYLPYGNTATGIVYPLTVIALAIGQCIGDGTAACISINQGKGDTKNTHKSVGTGITLGFIISIILLGISFGLAPQILSLFGAKENVLPNAIEYSGWIIAGFPFYILASIINPIVRADGSPKFAMLSMAIGAFVNIILDAIFVLTPLHMGLTGAALATFIGQVVSFVLNAAYLFKSKSFRLKLKSFLPKIKLFLTSIKLGVSSFLTQISIVIISVVSNNVLCIYMPQADIAIGIFTAMFKVFGIVVSVAIGVAVGGQPILGYNYGSKQYHRVKECFKRIMLTTIIVGLVATIIFEAAPQAILAIFGFSKDGITKSLTQLAAEGSYPADAIVSGTNSLLSFGTMSFRIYLGFILLTCIGKAVSIFFQSIGMPVKATLVAMLRDVIFLVPATLILPVIGGISAFYFAAPVADSLTMIGAIILVCVLFKNINAQINANKLSLANVNLSKVVKDKEDRQSLSLQENVESKKSKKSKKKNKQTSSNIIVTISREHGAGGREIGKKLAERLDVPFYDKEVAAIAAKESGLASEYVEGVAEKDSLLYNLYLSTEANQLAISAQQKVLKQIAEIGSCVIVGRAADYVLRDYNPCKIMVYADEEFKIKRIMNNYGDNEKQAKNNMKKSDKRRAKFYKTITGEEWANKENYNLCIDSSVGIETAVQTIYEYLKNTKI